MLATVHTFGTFGGTCKIKIRIRRALTGTFFHAYYRFRVSVLGAVYFFVLFPPEGANVNHYTQ